MTGVTGGWVPTARTSYRYCVNIYIYIYYNSPITWAKGSVMHLTGVLLQFRPLMLGRAQGYVTGKKLG